MSKSREAIFEKVANSNLKKSLSKSRERLCDMRLSLGKSREYLNEKNHMSKSQDKFYNFKSLSKSQEVISSSLGGAMKRMVNGAVSDISHALPLTTGSLQQATTDSEVDSEVDFVLLPGNSMLMTHQDIMKMNFDTSLQLLPISESGSSVKVGGSIQDLPSGLLSARETSTKNSGDVPKSILLLPATSAESIIHQPIVELKEEEEEAEQKEEKKVEEETKQPIKKVTQSIGIQVDFNSEEFAKEMASIFKKKLEDIEAEVRREKEAENREKRKDEEAKIERELAKFRKEKELELEKEVALQKSLLQEIVTTKEIPAAPEAKGKITKTLDDSQDDKKEEQKVSESPKEDQKVPENSKENQKVSESSKENQGKIFNKPLEKLVITRSKSTAALKSIQEPVDDFKKQRSVSPMPQSRKDSSGFSHPNTLGEEKKNHPWKTEVAKFQLQKRVSELIGTFDKSDLREGETPEEVKQRRRGSLQIDSDLNNLEPDIEATNNCRTLKLLRRKSTSAILSNPEMNILNLTDILMESSAAVAAAEAGLVAAAAEIKAMEKQEKEEEKENIEINKENNNKDASDKPAVEPKPSGAPIKKEVAEKPEIQNAIVSEKLVKSPSMKRSKEKNWDYFEIDHPKAISDKKLQQLKAKYQRRKTESVLKESPIKEEDEKVESESLTQAQKSSRVPTRSNSVPIVQGINASKLKTKALKLSIDPLTGECLEAEEDSLDTDQPHVIIRKVSTDSSSTDDSSSGCSSASRKSSRSSRRRSSLLADIQEQAIPEEKILEVRIDPLTGAVETVEVSKPKSGDAKNKGSSEQRQKKLTSQLSVDVLAAASAAVKSAAVDDDGIGSLPHTPTDLNMDAILMSSSSNSGSTRLDDGIFTSSEEVLESIPSNNSTGNNSSSSSTLSWDESSTNVVAAPSGKPSSLSSADTPPSDNNNEQITSTASTTTDSFSKAMEKFKSGASSSRNQGASSEVEPEKVKLI